MEQRKRDEAARLEQKRRDEAARLEQKRREEEAEREFRATFGQVVATQDAEYHIGLMHDQLRNLQIERGALEAKIAQMSDDLESASQLRRNAELRLERYGENPKMRAEAEKAMHAETEVQQPLVEA